MKTGLTTWKDRGSALNEALGPRRYMLGALTGAVIGFADWAASRLGQFGVGSLFGLPSWAVGVIAAVLVVVWCLVDRLAQTERRMKGARIDLSKLRSEGVKLRNDGMEVTTATWEEWRTMTEDWNKRTIACIGKIDQGWAEWFSVLDVVPTPRVEGVRLNGPQIKAFNEHDCRVSRLGELIQDLWEK